MEDIAIQILVAVGLMVFTAIATFFTTKHNLKEYTNQKYSELKDKLHKLELETEKLRGRDENQQQIIDTFQKQVLDHLPVLFDIVNSKKSRK